MHRDEQCRPGALRLGRFRIVATHAPHGEIDASGGRTMILTPPLCDMAVVLQTIEAAGVPYVRVSPFLYPGRSA